MRKINSRATIFVRLFHTLQDFSTKFWNFTTFERLFAWISLFPSGFVLIKNESIFNGTCISQMLYYKSYWNVFFNCRTESYQEGSIKHPSHTMYPKCHHCPSNSLYEDCVSKTTLKKCDSGLNNICFTKSFYSKSRGVVYEMGCSNHQQCQKAMAAPCKGNNVHDLVICGLWCTHKKLMHARVHIF
jgi:hypothetical protein